MPEAGPPTKIRYSQRMATALARSFLLRSGKELHELHSNDWQMGGSFVKKLLANLYLILNDFGTGAFPPKLPSREELFAAERKVIELQYAAALEEGVRAGIEKPFNVPRRQMGYYLWSYTKIIEMLESAGVNPGAKVMEFACGFGWLSEFLALRGYDVTGATIAPFEVDHANVRAEALRAKKGPSKLRFVCTPMEEVDRAKGLNPPYDAVLCFEGLHHAFDWRETLAAATKALRPGGYLFLCSEPTSLHTYICYRSATIQKTYEIGFKQSEMVDHLRSLGYDPIRVERPIYAERLRDFWKRFLPFGFGGGSLTARSLWIVARRN